MTLPNLAFPTQTLPTALITGNGSTDFWQMTDERSSNSQLHFSVIIPQSWKPVEAEIPNAATDDDISTLAFCAATDGSLATLSVLIINQKDEISPDVWLDFFLKKANEQVLHRRLAHTEGGNLPDVLTVRQADDNDTDWQVSRWLVLKDWSGDGACLFVLQLSCREFDYRDLAVVFLRAITSFQLLNRNGWPLAERLKTFSRKYPQDFLLLYPDKWLIQENPASTPDQLSLRLLRWAGSHFLAWIDVVVITNQLAGGSDGLTRRLAEKYGLPDVVFSPAKPFGDLAASWEATIPLPDRYGWLLLGRYDRAVTGPVWFLLELNGPTYEQTPLGWGIATRAAELVRTYLKTIIN